MYCGNCGAYNEDNAVKCSGCNCDLKPVADNSQPQPQPQPQQNYQQPQPQAYQPQQSYQQPQQQAYQPQQNYQPQPNYQQQSYQPQNNMQSPQDEAEKFATISLVLGIVAFFCCGVPCGVGAIITAKMAKNKGYVGGKATAGMICGIAAIALSIIVGIIYSIMMAASM